MRSARAIATREPAGMRKLQAADRARAMSGPPGMPTDPFGEHGELVVGRAVLEGLAVAVDSGGRLGAMYQALDALSRHDMEWGVVYAVLRRAGMAHDKERGHDTVESLRRGSGRRSEGDRLLAEISRKVLNGGLDALRAAVVDLDLQELRAVLRDPIETQWFAYLRDLGEGP